MLSAQRLLVLALCASLWGCALGAQTAPADFGDAPAPYPTCRHEFPTTIPEKWTNIGRLVSDDSAGANPVPGGIGADSHDDGVIMRGIQPGAGITPSVKAAYMQVNSWSALYDRDAIGVWADFNDDGDWDDTGEQVIYAMAGFSNSIPGQPQGYFSAGWASGFNINVPSYAVGPTLRVRVRVWNAVLSSGEFARGQGTGLPYGDCIGGECEDYAFSFDTIPEIFVYDPQWNFIYSGADVKVSGLDDSTPATFNFTVYNITSNGAMLSINSVSVSQLNNCQVGVLAPTTLPKVMNPNTSTPVQLSVLAGAQECSFTVTIHNNDPDEFDFVIHVQGRRGLRGNYIIDNTPSASADFDSIGAAMDEIERSGIVGNVVFEVREGPAPYVSDERCGLGIVNNFESDRVVNIQGLQWGGGTVVFRAAPGQHPKISGDGARFRLGDQEFRATIAIGVGYVTIEGLEITGGRDFGVAVVGDDRFYVENFIIRGCRIHGIAEGPGIFVLSQMDAATFLYIEHNFLWDCGVGQANLRQVYSGQPNPFPINLLRGTISLHTNGMNYIRHNTIYANGPAPTSGNDAACISFIDGRAHELFANIFIQADATQPFIYCYSVPYDHPQTSDRNCFFGPANTPWCKEGEPAGMIPNFPVWQAFGFDMLGSVQDPKVRSLVTPVDLHLKANSPLIDAFTANGTALDVDGEVRPQRAGWDIGADEVPPDPQVVVQRAGNPIADGGVDDFGTSIPPNTPTDFTYTILNNGQGPLQLTGSPRVALSVPLGVTAQVVSAPPATIPALGSGVFTIRVTAPTGAFRIGISFANNDPTVDPFNWDLTADTPPQITVVCNGQVVAPNQTLAFPWGTTIESLGLVITVVDPDSGQTVALQGSVANGSSRGIVNGEFSSPAILTPYSVNPTSGVLDANQGSLHLVTLLAHDGYMGTYFTFSIRGQPGAALIEVFEGGPNGQGGHPVANGTPAAGTIRSFAMRDMKAGPSAAIQIVVENMGQIPVQLSTPDVTGLHRHDFRVNVGGYGSVMPPGTSTIIYITFDPTAVGQRMATLELYHGGSNLPNPFVLPLEGTGVDVPPVEITADPTLPTARSGDQFAPISLTAAGGLSPYQWSVASGSLPDGLVLTPQGDIHGLPVSGAGTYNIGIRVRDVLGNESQKPFTMRVLPPRPPRALPNDGLAGRDNGSACAPAGSGPLWLAALPLLWLLYRRLRRREA